jgi:hypothetical protein
MSVATIEGYDLSPETSRPTLWVVPPDFVLTPPVVEVPEPLIVPDVFVDDYADLSDLVPAPKPRPEFPEHVGNIIRTDTSLSYTIDPGQFASQEQIDQEWDKTRKAMASLSMEVIMAVAEGRAELTHLFDACSPDI